MYEDYDIVFVLLDKIIEIVEKIYIDYVSEKQGKRVNIELGNLYTIKEEEEDCFKEFYFEDFILV